MASVVSVVLAAEDVRPILQGSFRINDQSFTYTLTRRPAPARVKRSFFSFFNKEEESPVTDLGSANQGPSTTNTLTTLNNVLNLGDTDSSSESLLDTVTTNLEAGIIVGLLESIQKNAVEDASEDEGEGKKKVLPIVGGVLILMKLLAAVIGIAATQGAF